MAAAVVDARSVSLLADTHVASTTPANCKPNGKHKSTDRRPTTAVNRRPGTAADSARARRERPCDACRRRKYRCVIPEGKVLCVLCEFHHQACTFVESPLPRKRKPSGDVDKVESGPQRASTALALSSTSRVRRTSPRRHDRPIKPEPSDAGSAIVASTQTEDSIGVHKLRHCRYFGPTAPYDGILLELSHFDEHNEASLDCGTLRRVNDHDCFVMYSDADMQHGGVEDAELLAEVQGLVSPHGSALVRLYFHVVHPSFPIVHKQLFLERVRNNDWEFTPALLAAIYLLAAGWWFHDPLLMQYPQPDIARLDSVARRALAQAIQRPKLSSVQAGLLLLQRQEMDSWTVTTQLVAVGQELGLHLDCSQWEIPRWERALRQRVAWALYMQDKWSSLIHGRPSHIFDANWAVLPLVTTDLVDEATSTAPSRPMMGGSSGSSSVARSEPTSSDPGGEDDDDGTTNRGPALFAQMIHLTRIMAEIMDTFYTQTAIAEFDRAGSHATRLILDRAKPLQIRLKDWFADLPAACRIDLQPPRSLRGGNSSSNLPILSPTGYLHLAYFATEITLHRRIVQSFPTDARVEQMTSSDRSLLYICRSAAKTRLISAMDFVNRLKPHHLAAFWYFASKVNFTLIGTFGSLLWATAPGHEEAEFYRARLREYRWTLSVSAKRAPWLVDAVSMLDATTGLVGTRIANKLRIASPSSSTVGAATSLSGAPLPTDDADNIMAVLMPSPRTQQRQHHLLQEQMALMAAAATASSTSSASSPSAAGPEFAGFPLTEAMAQTSEGDVLMEEDEEDEDDDE